MKVTLLPLLAASAAFAVQSPCFALADFWTRAQGPMGGMVQALAADNAGTVLAGTNKAGIFRSTDRGQTWRSVSSGLGDLTVVELELFRGTVWIASTCFCAVSRSLVDFSAGQFSRGGAS